MTIIVAFKAAERVILGADGAALVPWRQPDGSSAIIQIFETATKVFQVGEEAMGAAFWGSAAIGSRPLSTLVGEFNRTQLRQLQSEQRTVNTVAHGLFEFLRRQHNDVYGALAEQADGVQDLVVGGLVCGYSPGAYYGEGLEFEIPFREPAPVWQSGEDAHPVWRGQVGPLARLISGCAPELLEDIWPIIHEKLGDDGVRELASKYQPSAVFAAMPLQEALDLVRWMLRTTIGYFRFAAGPPKCAGEIDVALITPSGFEWKDHKEVR